MNDLKQFLININIIDSHHALLNKQSNGIYYIYNYIYLAMSQIEENREQSPVVDSQTNILQPQQKSIEETVNQQQALIDVLKKQITRLQTEVISTEISRKENQRLYNQALQQIDSQKQKIETLKQNNQSIIHTFEVFQREFVKRDYKNRINMPIQRQNNKQTDGPFFLQLIRNMKSKFTESSITESFKPQQKSILNEYYGYFFHEDAQNSETELYNEITSKNQYEITKLLSKKIKEFGRRRYFNQKHRPLFWYLIFEKPLGMTMKLYEQYAQKCDNNRQNQPEDKNTLIDRDLNRMDFKLDQQKGRSMKSAIKKCLQTFQFYRPDIGYVQGMSYLAWMLLMRMDDFKAFQCFANLIICDPFVNSLYMFKQHAIRKIILFFQRCMEEKRSKVYKHMKNLQVESQLFIIEWAYTMFTRSFSLRVISKIWDLWLCDGYNVFFRVTLVIMDMLQPQILEMNENDKIIQLLRSQTHKLDEAQFLKWLKRQRLPQQLQL